MELRNVSRSEETKLTAKHRMSFVFTMVGIILLALVSATYAWFTLSATNELDMLEVNAHAGTMLRFDTYNHGNDYDSYLHTVTSERIDRALSNKDRHTLDELKLEQLTSGDGVTFYRRSPNEKKGLPITFERSDGILAVDFWFIADNDMYVHLTSLSEGEDEGTEVKPADDREASEYAYNCMRISFVSEDGEKAIYEPSGQNDTKVVGQAAAGELTKVFTLPAGDEFKYSDDNKLFFLEKGKAKKVTMYVWIEGEDPDCVEKACTGSVDIRLRFVGTDEDNKPVR